MERSYFFDSTETDQRIYQAADFARFHAQIIGNGVSNTASLPDLAVEPKQNMIVSLGAGYAFANGYMYENTAALDLELDIAEPDVDRIDRIVVCFDNNPSQRRVFAYVKKGVPGSEVPPSITRDSYIFELSVARIKVLAGKSFIEATEIIDERTNEEVCGYIPLHNIYRGLKIDENGIVSLLNQSFIKTLNTAGVELINREFVTLPFGQILGDTQNEIINDTQIKVKADGVYNVWVEVGFYLTSFPDGIDIQPYLFVNGKQEFPLGAKVLSGNDNYVICNAVDYLNKDDVIEVRVKSFETGTGRPMADMVRLRVAKIS